MIIINLKVSQIKFDIVTYDVDSKQKNIPRFRVPLFLSL